MKALKILFVLYLLFGNPSIDWELNFEKSARAENEPVSEFHKFRPTSSKPAH